MSTSENLEQYWTERYQNKSTGWDLGEASTPIKEYVDQLSDKNIKLLIPGAGNAYEAHYLFKAGFRNVHIIDIAQQPLKNFKNRLPDFPDEQIIHGDFFALEDQFDLIIEQTFFCSFPPTDGNRERYVDKMHALLKPEGKLVGVWFDIPLTDDLTKRPFGGTKAEYISLFEQKFEFNVFDKCRNSILPRQGNELFAILQKK